MRAQPPLRPRGRARRLPVALAAAAVIGSYVGVRTGAVDDLDRRLGRRLARPTPRRSDVPLGVGTDLGSSFGLAGVTAGLAVTGHRRLAGEVAAAGTAAWMLAQAIKPALGRARPFETGTAPRLVAAPAGSSWPSGHAAVAAAMARCVAAGSTAPAGLVAAGAAATVGASRIAVGVHHLSDVVAGAGVGVLAAALAEAIHERSRRWITTR